MKKLLFIPFIFLALGLSPRPPVPVTVYSGNEITSSGTTEVELQFGDLATNNPPNTVVFIQVSSSNSGTIQFSVNRTIDGTYTAWAASSQIPMTITNGLRNLRYKASASGQKFSISHYPPGSSPGGSSGTVTGVTATAPIVITGTATVAPNVTVTQSTTSTNGYLSSTDWNTFNGKQSAITFGAGVQTALGVNVGSAGAPVVFNGAGGAPTSLTIPSAATATTQTANDNSTKVATTAYVNTIAPFMVFTGPTTTTKTYTLPNATTTILTTNAAVTGIQGGTGQTTTAVGDILVGAASNTWSKLAHGSANTIFGVNNAGTTGEYKTVSNGLIAGSGTLQAGGSFSDIEYTGTPGGIFILTIENDGIDGAFIINDVHNLQSINFGLGSGLAYDADYSSTYGDRSLIDQGSLTSKYFLKGSATLNFPNTTTGVSDLTITVTGATAGKPCYVGVPNGSVTTTATFTCWVSAINTATVRFSPKAVAGEDPASGSFLVTVDNR